MPTMNEILSKKTAKATKNEVHKAHAKIEKERKPYVRKFNKGKPKGFNVFDSKVTPVEPDLSKLKRFSRTFTGHSSANVPEKILTELEEAVDTINELGFTFRSSADNEVNIDAKFIEFTERTEFYVPWVKGFNTPKPPVLEKSTELAHQISCWVDVSGRMRRNEYNKKPIPADQVIEDYNMLSPAIKQFSARNIHMLLGSDCQTVVNFILVYSKCGAETSSEIDWLNIGRTGYWIQMAYTLDISIFNLGSDGAIERLQEFLETFK